MLLNVTEVRKGVKNSSQGKKRVGDKSRQIQSGLWRAT